MTARPPKNYVDLGNPHNLMPHLEQAETDALVDMVKTAFAAAREQCPYTFQEDVRPRPPCTHPKNIAFRPGGLTGAPLCLRQNVRNQIEHITMLLANLTLRHHSIWFEDCHKMARVLKHETFNTYTGWCDKMQIPLDNRFLESTWPTQRNLRGRDWDSLAQPVSDPARSL
jgi:hypothetical protein